MVPVPVNGAGNLLTLTRISLGSSERQEALSEKGPVMHYQLIPCAARRKTYSCRVVKTAYLTASWDRYCCSICAGSMVSICSTYVRTQTTTLNNQSTSGIVQYMPGQYTQMPEMSLYHHQHYEHVQTGAQRERDSSRCFIRSPV